MSVITTSGGSAATAASSDGRSSTSAMTSMSSCAANSLAMPSRTRSESSATITRIDTPATLLSALADQRTLGRPLGRVQLSSWAASSLTIETAPLAAFPLVRHLLVVDQPGQVGAAIEELDARGGPRSRARGRRRRRGSTRGRPRARRARRSRHRARGRRGRGRRAARRRPAPRGRSARARAAGVNPAAGCSRHSRICSSPLNQVCDPLRYESTGGPSRASSAPTSSGVTHQSVVAISTRAG